MRQFIRDSLSWRQLALMAIVVLALLFAGRALPVNYGGGEGGYAQLPACGPAYYGVELYVQGHLWRCVRDSPDHWVQRS